MVNSKLQTQKPEIENKGQSKETFFIVKQVLKTLAMIAKADLRDLNN